MPQALEKVLAFKDMRAQQVGVKPEDIEKVESGIIILHSSRMCRSIKLVCKGVVFLCTWHSEKNKESEFSETFKLCLG